MTITERIIYTLLAVRSEDIGESAYEAAQHVLLDTVGSGLAASRNNIGAKLLRLADANGEDGLVVWGTSRRASLVTASFINSFLAQVLDFDDTQEVNSLAVGHPRPAIVPLALCCAEKNGSSGTELLKALVLAYELCMRFTESLRIEGDIHFSFSNTQILGAITAASLLFGLGEEEFVNAVGIALASCPIGATKGMWNFDCRPMSWLKDGVGFVAETALRSVQLAKAGYRGSRSALDPSDEYYKLCGSESYAPDVLFDGFKGTFAIERISFKPYPTCRYIQSILDAVLAMQKERDFKNDDIRKIEITTTPFLAQEFDVRRPQTMIDAQFSLPYTISAALSQNPPSSSWYTQAFMKERVESDVINKIHFFPDESIEKRRMEANALESEVTILLHNGARLNRRTAYAKGHPRAPFCLEDHVEKFVRNVRPVIGGECCDNLLSLLLNVREIKNTARLASLLGVSDAPLDV